MAKSFRLSPDLEKLLEKAARTEGVPVSTFIRQAVRQRCEEVLDRNLATELADCLGVIATGGGLADDTGKAFKELLKTRRGQ